MKDGLLWLYESLILVDVLLGQGYKNILHMLNLKREAMGTNGGKKNTLTIKMLSMLMTEFICP